MLGVVVFVIRYMQGVHDQLQCRQIMGCLEFEAWNLEFI